MRKPGVDENDVQMSDVLCDYCHREWTDDLPMMEGHHGSCICGKCLTQAFREVVLVKENGAGEEYKCTMCLEAADDRAALNRAGEPGWRSPIYPDACACRRCIKLAAGALHKDADYDWRKPEA
jgi:hypothetical protein